MKTLLWAERLKLKRSKILWITTFSVVMIIIIVYLQGQFIYNGERYVDRPSWYMTAVQSLGGFYIFPAIIAMMGSYLVCREEQNDTLKTLYLVPVNLSDLIRVKMVITAFFSIALYAFLFMVTLSVEVGLHLHLLEVSMILNSAKMYLLEGICVFLAVSPVIAVTYRLKKGYWIALIFAEIYSFLGLFIGQSKLLFIYPITAAFCVAGYYEATPVQLIISLFSLLICSAVSLMILKRLNNKSEIY